MSLQKKKYYFVGTREAFSLVEVTLALGITVFCLVTLLGLLQVGLQQERRSVDQTRAAFVLTSVVDDLFSVARKPYAISKLPSTDLATKGYSITLPALGEEPREVSFRVDSTGKLISDVENNSYVVHVRMEPPAKTDGIFAPYKLRLFVAWPGSAEFFGSGDSLQLRKAQGNIEATLELNRG